MDEQLTPEESALLAEYARQIEALESERRGVLRMIHRAHKLSGDWRLDGDRLVRQDAPRPPLPVAE